MLIFITAKIIFDDTALWLVDYTHIILVKIYIDSSTSIVLIYDWILPIHLSTHPLNCQL